MEDSKTIFSTEKVNSKVMITHLRGSTRTGSKLLVRLFGLSQITDLVMRVLSMNKESSMEKVG